MERNRVKEFLGQRVTIWLGLDARGFYFGDHTGILNGINGNNILIGGEWHWIPQIKLIELAKGAAQ